MFYRWKILANSLCEFTHKISFYQSEGHTWRIYYLGTSLKDRYAHLPFLRQVLARTAYARGLQVSRAEYSIASKQGTGRCFNDRCLSSLCANHYITIICCVSYIVHCFELLIYDIILSSLFSLGITFAFS